ncbi:MAG: hypothetical protein FJ125_16265, partial [Deltaproteobacteria bacterium]|nr:hypothetical protein [Deltaproteobacteria bacterium]
MSSSIEQRTLTEDERKALLRQAGNALIVNLHSLTRATSLHDLNNRSLDRPADGIVEALTQLRQVERLSISLNTSQGAVYVNATRLMLEQQSFSFVQSLESFFGRVDSSGLRFADELTTDQIKAYLHFANRWRPPVGEKNVLPLFRKALREARLTGVEPTQRIRITVDGEEHRLPGVLGLQTYAKMVAAFNRLMAQPVIPLSLAQRLVQDLLDALRVEGDLLLALTIVPVSEMSFVRRTVNTTIITLAMMQNLGTFPRSLLSDVGLAALLGRVEEHRRSSESGAQAEDEVWRPLEALGKPAELSPGGVRTLLAS